MKCGIITIHNVPNYGATFQAYGLFKYIKDTTQFDVEFIDYTMNQKVSITHSNAKGGNKWLLKVKKLLGIQRYLGIKKRVKSFEKFFTRHFQMSSCSYGGDNDISANPPIYDVYIAGSDQLFNLSLTNESYAYFLKFFNGKKISYSTSFGMKGLQPKYVEVVGGLLSEFDALSVRELTARRALHDYYNIEAEVTADPVFLISGNEWAELCKAVRTPEKYIFCYLMSDNPNIYKTIDWIQKKDKLPIIVLHTFKKKLKFNCKYVDYCAPEEFLYLIKNATYVVTNSFHGSAFSIIFRRSLFILEEEKYIGDQRYAAMLEKSKMTGKVVPYDTNWDTYLFEKNLIDGDIAYTNLEPWIKRSKDFIRSNLSD